ncbi:hypothetical protein EB796_000069 [Bugula neritina]|uniref:Uncharacterized protein n=1 Tax=Bugula neritina TaxID=10212 RepID=A0A7J7KTW9_BUGNE|nr:hypothetical protein EB796_000069 [Bugula neritina]
MSTSTMSAHAIPSHEQSELDEILRELLGDTHTTTTRSPSHRVQPSAHPPVNYGRGHSVESPDGNGWLEQQQRKLSQRQLSREQEDVTQRHRQQKQLLSELRHVQTKRQDSLADDFNANNMYRTERDVMVTTQEPAAYTVYIKPEEQPQEIVQEETKTSISKSSVTNVSHTHHNHYNFHDNSDEEQKRRIKELEDELRKVKTGLHQQSPPPVRPQKLNFDDEDEEEYSFKPVGIASLESGTDGTSRSRLAHFSSTSSAASTPVGTSKQVVSTPTTPVSPVVTTNGQPITQTNTTQSRSMYSSNISSPQPVGAVMSPSHNVVTSSHNLVTSSPLSPPTPYQLMSPLTSPFSDTVQPGTGSRQQRTVMEEKRVQQHIYHHPVYPAGGSQVGTLPSQHSMTQVNRQQHEPVTATVSYDLASIGSPGNLTGTENLPFTQALQAGASNVHTDQPGVIYTSIAGSTSPPGRSQHTNDSVSNQTADYGQPLSAKFVKDTSKYWYKPHIGRDEELNNS